MSGDVLYGTICTLRPAVDLNSSAPRFCVPPTAMVPILSLPGCVFAALMKSPSVLYSDSALTTNTRSKVPTIDTISKSFTGSNGRLLNAATLIAVPLVTSAMV